MVHMASRGTLEVVVKNATEWAATPASEFAAARAIMYEFVDRFVHLRIQLAQA